MNKCRRAMQKRRIGKCCRLCTFQRHLSLKFVYLSQRVQGKALKSSAAATFIWHWFIHRGYNIGSITKRELITKVYGVVVLIGSQFIKIIPSRKGKLFRNFSCFSVFSLFFSRSLFPKALPLSPPPQRKKVESSYFNMGSLEYSASIKEPKDHFVRQPVIHCATEISAKFRMIIMMSLWKFTVRYSSWM